MKLNKPKLNKALLLFSFGLLVGLILIFSAPSLLFKNSAEPLAKNFLNLPNQGKGSLPLRLRIPIIGVDSLVENVGLTAAGAMGVPVVVGNVGWFSLGKRPGEIGSAVIDGHYGLLKKGGSSVFDNLNKLKIGDKISVENYDGGIISFVVKEIKHFEPEADASSVFVSNDGKAHLNLITCEGVWDKVSESYSKRLVVFADKE
ncbi:MAG: class F sortase [Candidatus Pacebacteria bacterium]|nr:class F sortase [Candidatus Paceibacterota bacterium]